ncbi:hypothetical protein Fmac_027749 [Flemingia macrophylla]|uniref:Uncharacterized protein n=1 Tax=Flemingia macrophylla TaxID=520843 RepID=A0ABD1LIL3_9FABA
MKKRKISEIDPNLPFHAPPISQTKEKTGDVRVGTKGYSSSRIMEHVPTPCTLSATRQKTLEILVTTSNPSKYFHMKKYEDSNQGKVVNATRYGLPDSQELDDQLKENYQIPETKLLELESRPYFSDHVLSPTFLRSNERITPCAEFATYLSHNFQPLYSITEPECKLSANPSFSATIKSDVTLGSPFNETANATRYGLRNRELDVRFTERHQISKRKLLELESSSSFSDHLLSPVFLRSVEVITPHANFPTYPHKLQPLLSITEDKSDFGSRSFIDEDNVTQGFLSNKQENEIFTCNHFNELGKFDTEPIPLLMEKDFDCTADETNLPITCKYIKPGIPPDLSILGHGKEQILNGALKEYYFSPSSSLLDKPRDFNSILDSGFLRFREFKFGKYVYEGLDTNFNHTALSLSHNKQHFNVPENCKIDTSCDQDSMLFSPYQHWAGRTVSDTYHHHSNPETWLPSPLDECKRCWSLTSSHLNYRSSSSRTLQLPQRESVSSPSHINDNYKPERYGENHGEVLYHFRENSVEIYNSSFLHMSMQRNNGCAFPLDGSDYVNEQGHTQKLLL